MAWRSRGLNNALHEAEDQIRAAAARSDMDLEVYRAALENSLNPIIEQLFSNPHDAVYADIQRLRRPGAWYVAYSEFDSWALTYWVVEETSFIFWVKQLDEAGVADFLLGDGGR